MPPPAASQISSRGSKLRTVMKVTGNSYPANMHESFRKLGDDARMQLRQTATNDDRWVLSPFRTLVLSLFSVRPSKLHMRQDNRQAPSFPDLTVGQRPETSQTDSRLKGQSCAWHLLRRIQCLTPTSWNPLHCKNSGFVVDGRPVKNPSLPLPPSDSIRGYNFLSISSCALLSVQDSSCLYDSRHLGVACLSP